MSLFVQIPEGKVGIVERNNTYLKTIFPGSINFLVPIIDKIYTYDLKPKTHKFPMFSILIKNQYTIDIEILMKYKIMEPWKARYEVENFDLEFTAERLVIKLISNSLSSKNLEEAIDAKTELNELLKNQLNTKSRLWGFKLIYIEIQSMKKSFLAEQEKENLYDIHKGERGVYMSEKIDTSDPSKAIHSHEDEISSEHVDFTSLTSEIVMKKEENVSVKLENLKSQIDKIDNIEEKQSAQVNIDIYKQHQEEMIKLQEKDLKKQQDDLLFQVQEMQKKQEEILKKQNELLNQMKELDKKKQEIDKFNND